MSLQVKIYFVVIPFSFSLSFPPVSSPSPVVLTSVSAELRLQQTELINKKKEKKSAYSPNHSRLLLHPPFLPHPSLPPSQHPPQLLALAFSQTITTSRNSTEWPSEGSGLFHIYIL